MSRRKTALVTGASSGVGAATARALAGIGMEVGLVARRRERLELLAEEIRAAGGRALPTPADLSHPETAKRAVDQVLDALGGVDLLVNCLGTNVPRRRLSELSTADWDALLATNLSAIFYCVRAVLPGMRRGGGLIISVSSVAGLRPSVLSGAAYSAAKAGLNALSTCINLEEGANGVRSCVIAPGDIDTEILDKRPDPPPPEVRARMLRPEDVANLIVAVVQQPERALVEELVVRPV
jgi:NAD(P)-dependent dehydrogenase (short-subunit alcohol dehydrogenase family)